MHDDPDLDCVHGEEGRVADPEFVPVPTVLAGLVGVVVRSDVEIKVLRP